jgi:hypothetical protein
MMPHKQELKIEVELISPLIYRGQHNYVAWVNGEEEWGSATGETEEQARENLIEELKDAERICRRCGGPLDGRDSPDQAVCSDCQYDDWHEEYPDIPDLCPEEDGE